MTRHNGFTLIELVIAIVVVGIGVAGILLAFTQAVSRSADPMIQHQAIAIAESYLEEVLLRPFDDPGDGCPGRASHSYIFCYDGISEAPTDQFGTPLGLPDYTVTVSVTASPGLALPGVPGAEQARIEVNVTHPSGVSMTVTGYRTNY